MAQLKQVALSEYQSIVIMLGNLLANGYYVEFRSQPSGIDDEYVVIVTTEDGDTVSSAEYPDLVDAMEEAYTMTPDAQP